MALASLLGLLGTPATASAAEDLRDYVVLLAPSGDPEATADGVVARNGGQRRSGPVLSGVQAFVVRGSSGQARSLQRDRRVRAVEPDGVVRVAGQVLDTGVDRVSAPELAGATGPLQSVDGVDDVVVDADVAVLDTGIDGAHPDLDVVARADCRTAACVDDAGLDDNGHGSHVAGIIGAADGRTGTVGVAPGARLWSVKVLDRYGSGSLSGLLAGLDWVAKRSDTIDVVNMSLAYGESASLSAALTRLSDLGVTLVGAAGNQGVDASRTFPAAHPRVIAVSALADFDGRTGGLGTPTCRQETDDASARFSNYGPVVDLVAPGVCIRSSAPGGGTAVMSGTSMAAPHVAGAAALLASRPDHRGRPDLVRASLLAAGSDQWTDLSSDGVREPLLVIDTLQPVTVPEDGPPQLWVEDGRAVEPAAGTTAPVDAVVRLSRAPLVGQSVSVLLAPTTGTAAAGKDHIALTPVRLTFGPGQTRLTVPLTLLGDAEAEGTETLGLALSKPLGGVISDAAATIDLVEAAAAPLQRVSVDDVTAVEPESGATRSLTFPVRLSAPVPTGQTVSVVAATADGTARAGTDYTRLAPTTLVFAAGSTTQDVVVPLTGDDVPELDEAFTLVLSAPKGAALADAQGVAAVLDRRSAPQLSVSDAWSAEGTATERAATFTVSLDLPVAASQTVQVTVATAAGTAQSGTDFVALPATRLSFAPGEQRKQVAVRLVNDATGETDETLSLRLSAPGGAVVADAFGLGTVADDDRAPARPAPLTASVDDLVVLEPPPGASSTQPVRVVLDGPASSTATVLVESVNGTALAGRDYQAVARTPLVFAPGQQELTVDVTVLGTAALDGARTLSLRLSSPSPGLVLADDTSLVTVRDPLGSLGLSVGDVRVAEGNDGTRAAVFDLRLTGAPTAGQTVSVRVAPTAGTAAPGTDFDPAGSTVVVPAGSQAVSVTVPVYGDLLSEDDEGFSLVLSAPFGAVLADTAGQATVVDEEGPVRASVQDVRMLEGDAGSSALVYRVLLSSPPAAGQAVGLSVATGTSTATAGIDYVALPLTRLTFSAGQTSQEVSVTVLGDTAVELDERVALVLSAPVGLRLADTLGSGVVLTDEAP